MQIESSYDSLHSALRSIMNEGERGILTWWSPLSEGNLDIKRTSNGRIEYVTMPFSRLSRIIRTSPVVSLVVRIFDTIPPGEVLPTKRIYSFVANNGSILKLSADACAEQNCTDAMTGERLEPEPHCRYL